MQASEQPTQAHSSQRWPLPDPMPPHTRKHVYDYSYMPFLYILVWTESWSRHYCYGWSDIRAAELAAAHRACWVVIPECRRRYLDTISYDFKDFTFGSGFEHGSNPELRVRQRLVRCLLRYPKIVEELDWTGLRQHYSGCSDVITVV